MEGLPLLPGYTFKDPTVTKYHVSHSFDIKNGHCIPRPSTIGIGKEPLDSDSVQYTKFRDTTRFDPSLIYGRLRTKPSAVFRPHFVTHDKKCLAFQAFFRESIPILNLDEDSYRIRHVNIIYFLEDDSITVMEPPVENCGLPQGRLVKRGRIQKNGDGDLWHWKDLNVGIDMNIHGIVYRVCRCDSFTKEYLLSQGIELNPEEDLPFDPYTQRRKLTELSKMVKDFTPKSDDKLRRFLEYDGKVLRFFAVWEDRSSQEQQQKPYIIRYYLADDCIEISEVLQPNSGIDSFPKFLNKMRLPKDWKHLPNNSPASSVEVSEFGIIDYYEPKDFVVGSKLIILARCFLIYDCDEFTRKYFSECLRIEQPTGIPVKISNDKKQYPLMEVPPHIGIGTPDDTLQSCFSFVLKSPKKDVTKYVANAGKKLRYTATMDWVHPEDKDRDFIIEYFLFNSQILINELPKRNSGIKGGKFLSAMLLPKPGFFHSDNPEYYTPSDFGLGSVIDVFGHRFIITGADLKVYRYMQENAEKFSACMIESYRNHFMQLGMLTDEIERIAAKTEDLIECPRNDESSKVVGNMHDSGVVSKGHERDAVMIGRGPPISDSIETKVIDAALKPRKCPC